MRASIPGFKPDITRAGQGDWRRHAAGRLWRPRAPSWTTLAPLGRVYQAGTLSGNPVATACGLTTLREIEKPGFSMRCRPATRCAGGWAGPGRRGRRRALSADCEGGMFGFFLLPELPQNYPAVLKTDSARFNQLFHGLLDRGVYIAPALYEAGFVSGAHTADDIAATVAGCTRSVQNTIKIIATGA